MSELVERLIAIALEHAADNDIGIGCPRLCGRDCTTRACHKRGGWTEGPITLDNATCFDFELQGVLKDATAALCHAHDYDALSICRNCGADYWHDTTTLRAGKDSDCPGKP